MNYNVVIRHNGEQAVLPCGSLEEAQQVRQSFVNYGRYHEVSIEKKETVDDEL